jgi:hypothetical protein
VVTFVAVLHWRSRILLFGHLFLLRLGHHFNSYWLRLAFTPVDCRTSAHVSADNFFMVEGLYKLRIFA